MVTEHRGILDQGRVNECSHIDSREKLKATNQQLFIFALKPDL